MLVFPSHASSHRPSFLPQQLQPGLLNYVTPCYSSKPSGSFHLTQEFAKSLSWPTRPLGFYPAYVCYHSAPGSSHLASCSSLPTGAVCIFAPSYRPLLRCSNTFSRPLSISSLTNFLSLLHPIFIYLNTCLSCVLLLACHPQEHRDFTVLTVGLGL